MENKDRDLEKTIGFEACLALWKKRPEAVRRVHVQESRTRTLGAFLRWCAERRIPYHIVTAVDLERLTGSLHHGGLCIHATPQEPHSLGGLLSILGDRKQVRLVYLDGVGNPHNLGAILRSCAHFGVPALLVEGEERARLPPASRRTASGGAESVAMVSIESPSRELKRLQEGGFTLVGADARGADLFAQRLPGRCLFLLGDETKGLSPRLRRLCDLVVGIPGTEAVESLNVSCAAAVLLAEHWRRHG